MKFFKIKNGDGYINLDLVTEVHLSTEEHQLIAKVYFPVTEAGGQLPTILRSADALRLAKYLEQNCQDQDKEVKI